MFYYLNGEITYLEAGLAVVDCGGVGYDCQVSTNTLSALKTGQKAKLYTYCYIREDAFDLYGFVSQAEKRSFEMLLGVSGVGPKAALAILSANKPEALSSAIITSNEKALTAAAGVGKKLAQRIILELRDKLGKDAQGLASGAAAPIRGGDKLTEAMAALAVLGYNQNEIMLALHGIEPDALPLEEMIRQALKRMVK